LRPEHQLTADDNNDSNNMFVCSSLASIGTCNSVNNMDTRNANILKKKEDEEQEQEQEREPEDKQEQRADHTSNYPSYHFFSSPRWISHWTNKAVLQGQGYAIRMLYTAPRACDFPLHNIVVSRHPLARPAGCSASTLSTTYHDCGQNKYTRLSHTLLRDPESQKKKNDIHSTVA
jgi:hypothetical protein